MEEYGYYDDSSQTTPTYDPGLTVSCLICDNALTKNNVRTISLMVPGDIRSYFYRIHKTCHEQLSETRRIGLDSRLIDVIAEVNDHVN